MKFIGYNFASVAWLAAGVYLLTHEHHKFAIFCMIVASLLTITPSSKKDEKKAEDTADKEMET